MSKLLKCFGFLNALRERMVEEERYKAMNTWLDSIPRMLDAALKTLS